MKIIVFGAHGKTGQEVCKQAVHQGISVIGFDMQQHSQLIGLKNFSYISGSVLDSQAVSRAVKGVDAIVSELGVPIGTRQPVVSEGNGNIIAAMQAHHIARLITQSAFGAQESWQALPFHFRLVHKLILGPIADDKNRMERLVRDSDLDWTIIRPVRLTNGPARKQYRTGDASLPLGLDPKISRADVAHFIMSELEQPKFIRKAVTITY